MKIKGFPMIGRNHAIALFSMAAVLGSGGAAYAATITITGGSTTPPNTWTTETGQSVPTGTAGFVGGTLITDGGFFTFTYGGGGLVPGDTGHGDSSFPNEFWLGSSEAAAEAAGQVFCSQAGDVSCGGVATPVGTEFTVSLAPGPVSFGFTFGPTNSNVLLNGQTNNDVGAYLAQVGLGTTANAGPGSVAYLGLSDRAYPADADFQDLVVRVTVPEPASLSLLGAGLIGGVALYLRRRKNLVP